VRRIIYSLNSMREMMDVWTASGSQVKVQNINVKFKICRYQSVDAKLRLLNALQSTCYVPLVFQFHILSLSIAHTHSSEQKLRTHERLREIERAGDICYSLVECECGLYCGLHAALLRLVETSTTFSAFTYCLSFVFSLLFAFLLFSFSGSTYILADNTEL